MAAPFKFGREELDKLWKSILIAAVGAAIPEFIQWVSDTDWGQWNTIAIPLSAVIANALRLFVRNITGQEMSKPPSRTFPVILFLATLLPTSMGFAQSIDPP